MDKNTELYYQSAQALFLPAILEPGVNGFFIQLGPERYYYYAANCSLDDNMSSLIAHDKYWSNQLLAKEGIPVPKAKVINPMHYETQPLSQLIEGLSFPLVAKPRLGYKGFDVLCNIRTLDELDDYLKARMQEINMEDPPEFVIEEFHGNLKSYRVLLLNHRVIGIVLRLPPQVIGDGVLTVGALIEKANKERRSSSDTYGPIKMETECMMRLHEVGMDVNTVPQKGQTVFLGYVSNATQGGTYVGLKNKMCRANRKLLTRASRIIGLALVGFDVECEDIDVPITTQGVIIEPNCNPSIRIHEEESSGRPTKVTKKILRALIWRHPFYYVDALYRNPRTSVYIKSILALLGLGCLYTAINFFA